MEYPLLVYNFATGEVSSLALSLVAKHSRSGSVWFLSVTGSDMVQLSDLAYASLDSCRADRCAAHGETADVPAAVGCASVVVLEMDDLDVLLYRDAGWTQDVGSANPHLA